MISNEQNNALLIVGNAAAARPELLEYSRYCLLREKGLRKEAFQHLFAFINEAGKYSYEQKTELAKFLFPYFESVEEADYGPFPEPLRTFFKGHLEDWCAKETVLSAPFRWYGKYYWSPDHFLKALEIDPSDELARINIIQTWLWGLDNAVHHFPDGYIGELPEDLELIRKTREFIQELADKTWQKKLEVNLLESEELILNYNEWKISGHPDFESWGQKNGKRVHYGQGKSYYYEN